MNRAVHNNSLAAYWSGQEGAFSKREKDVLLALGAIGKGTAREIMIRLGFTDMNSVRPRLTELLKARVIEECGSVIDSETRKQVMRLRIKADPREPQAEFGFSNSVVVDGQLKAITLTAPRRA